MFSNLENFLNAKPVYKQSEPEPEPEQDSQESTFSNANDSWDLDLSIPKKNGKSKDVDDSKEKLASYVPSKGQKMAARRLKKIGDTLANNLVSPEKLQTKSSTVTSKQAASKRNARKTNVPRTAHILPTTSRQRRRRNIYLDDISFSESDISFDEPISINPRAVHDPNTIVLDCDDEFIGGPTVNFTRNVAAAAAVSAEESRELRVTVKINGKIEYYEMNAFQKLSTLIKQISEKKKVSPDHVALTFHDKMLSEFETPNSVGYVQGLIIKGNISEMNNKNKSANAESNANIDKLEIKIQAEGRKKPFITYINATDKLISLAFACVDEFKCDLDKVALEFDGEFINFNETAEDLELEGGEVMDFFKKK